jgi:hypothetical protein
MSDYPTPGEGYWYMAGPYSDNIEERYTQHLKAVALLTRCKLTIYSPIVHFHNVALLHNMPTDSIFWQEHDFNMIRSSKGLILLCLSNWAKSRGVVNELNFCNKNNIPVWAIEPLQPDKNFIDITWTKMLP